MIQCELLLGLSGPILMALQFMCCTALLHRLHRQQLLTCGHRVFQTRVATWWLGRPCLRADAISSATRGASRKERDTEKPMIAGAWQTQGYAKCTSK
jgi:hypothetical protein